MAADEMNRIKKMSGRREEMKGGGGGGWIYERKLGSGGFGDVTVWKNLKSGKRIALKECHFTKEMEKEGSIYKKFMEAWKKEVDILLRLNHRNVIKCFPIPEDFLFDFGSPSCKFRGDNATAVGEEKEKTESSTGKTYKVEDEEIYEVNNDISDGDNYEGDDDRSSAPITKSSLPILCMEFCSGGDLRNVLNKTENCCGLTEREVLTIIGDLTSALGYLHNRRIIHRDIKPENVVLSREDNDIIVYKLIDLGYAKELDKSSSLAMSFVGTLQYLAPELFMGEQYNKSVDYWSLGLITHEIITGQRPFLPNHSPGQWMQFVESKSKNVICIENIKEDGEPECRETFPPENRISSSLRQEIVLWLRSLLQYDSNCRGKNDQNNQIIVFEELNNILQKQRVHVISMDRCQHSLDFIITNSSLRQLELFIETSLGIPISNQLLLSSNGLRIDSFDLFYQDRNDLTIFVFDLKSDCNNIPQKIKEFSVVIPSSVKIVLSNSKVQVAYDMKKQIYAHSYFFIRQEEQIKQKLNEGRNVFISYLVNQVKSMNRLSNFVTQLLDKVISKYELFRESLNHDIEKYKDQAQRKERITSQKIFDSWIKSDSQIGPYVINLKDRISATDRKMKKSNADVSELQRRYSRRESLVSNEEDFVNKSFKSLENIRKINRRYHSDNDGPMDVAILVAKCLKQRDKNLQEHFAIYREFIEMNVEVSELLVYLETCRNELECINNNISKMQRKRQSDVWKMLTVALQQTGLTPSPSSSLSPSTSSSTPPVYPPSINSHEIIEENRKLRELVDKAIQETLYQN